MNDDERRTRGEAVRRRVLGDAHVDRAIAGTTPLTTEMQDLITRYAWGEIWTRPGLDTRMRRILAIGTLLALGRWEEFRMHAKAALTEGGFAPADLNEIVLQQAIYCGIPAANSAMRIVQEVVEERA
jgi:4-carboxymuconolactone decarboxylase